MRLTRIYQPQALNTGKKIDLSESAAHHLARVLRLSCGAEIILFNGEGGEFTAKIISSEKSKVSVQIGQHHKINRESPLQITLVQTLIRPEKMDYTLQKSVELGVTQIIPLLSERVSIKLSEEHWKKRLRHWQAIIITACEQSGRTQIPSIIHPLTFTQVIQKITADIRAILTPSTTQVVQPLTMSSSQVAILIGPEGGWSETEIHLATASGYLPLSLGPRILRSETAGLVAMTLFQSWLGDISRNLV